VSTVSKWVMAFFLLIGVMLILKNAPSFVGITLAGEQFTTGLVGAFGGNKAPQKGSVRFSGGQQVNFG